MKRIADWIIVGLAVLSTILFVLLILPLCWLEKKLFKTNRLDSFFIKWILIQPEHNYTDGLFSNKQVIDRGNIYTLEMYRNSHLPPFYFTRDLLDGHNQISLRKGDKYQTYRYNYTTLIQLLNNGTLTTNPEQ